MKQTQNHNKENDATQAKRLAFLLAQSVMPQEQKEAWINLLPVMIPDQVNQLIALLEREHAGYVHSSQTFLDDLKKLEQSLAQEIQQLQLDERRQIEDFIQQRLQQQT